MTQENEVPSQDVVDMDEEIKKELEIEPVEEKKTEEVEEPADPTIEDLVK